MFQIKNVWRVFWCPERQFRGLGEKNSEYAGAVKVLKMYSTDIKIETLSLKKKISLMLAHFYKTFCLIYSGLYIILNIS